MTSYVGERTATYRDVFAVGEFRALFSADALSLVGDQLAKVAVAVLVYSRTHSPLLSAVAFGIGYLPWVVGGPLLSGLADRMPRRAVLVSCDLARMALVALIAIPGMPLPVLLFVLFLVGLLTPPFASARAALMPEILDGDAYVLGNALTNVMSQLGQVIGFAVGGAIVATITPRGALVIDAATFLLSGLVIQAFVRERRPEPPGYGQPPSLWRDAVDGARLVFGSRVLRAYVLLVWVASAFVYAPEGLAAPFAEHLGGGPRTVGLLLAAPPLGVVAGAFLVTRLAGPAQRRRALRPLAVIACLALLPIAADPPLTGVLACYLAAGLASAFLIPLNAMFIQAAPASYRGRAFGLAQAGLMVSQGVTIFVAGAVAGLVVVPYVVAASGALGTLGVLLIVLDWPSEEDVAARVGYPAPARRGRHRARRGGSRQEPVGPHDEAGGIDHEAGGIDEAGGIADTAEHPAAVGP